MITISTMDSLPEHCYECPCHDGESGYCQADKERRYSDYRPYWCPLKEQEPMPVLMQRECETLPNHYERKGFCPNCHQVVEWFLNRSYCGFCGQAVKWDA